MFEARILQPQDEKALEEFEKMRLSENSADEFENELLSWHASWRKESLEHYLPLGWSFGIWSNDKIVGYFLAQPYLFMRGMTQTLWIERIVSNTVDGMSELIEIAYKLSREKHFQKILFNMQDDVTIAHSVFQLSSVGDNILELKTAKF